MRLAILLLCSAVGFGQSTTTSPPEPKAQPKGRCGEEFGLSINAHGHQMGSLDILSDPQGVDFGPYVERMVQKVNVNWHKLVPASESTKRGRLAIEFAIRKDGKLAEMCLGATSGDVALDRAAWGGITAANPFPTLPSDFTGPYLAVRFRFYYNPDRNDLN
jgi:TonB family protein